MNNSANNKSLAAQQSGDLLVSEFQSALINLTTMDVATAEAEHSETNIENALKYNATHNGIYLKPEDISPDTADILVKNSIDAHLKKIQAEQIKSFTTNQLSHQQLDSEQKYKGRKVRITVLTDRKDVFIPLWANKQTGQLREGTYKGQKITGKIDDLVLENNILVIKPGLFWRTIQPDRRFFLVVVIDLMTMTPNVRVELLS